MGRKATFAGEETFLGRGVSYCATCDGAFYRDSEVVVVGDNQEAAEEGHFLTKFASTVHVVTRSKAPAVAQVRPCMPLDPDGCGRPRECLVVQ